MKSLRHVYAGRASGRARRAKKALFKWMEARRENRRRPLTAQDCVYYGDDPDEPCWGKTTCWAHSKSDHSGCEALCHGHRDCHPGNDFTGSYREQDPL